MPTITMPELVETEGQLTERRAKLKSYFDEAGPALDLTQVKSLDGTTEAKAEAFQALDDEINVLATKAERLRNLKRIAEAQPDDADLDAGIERGGDDQPRGKAQRFSDAFLKSAAFKTKGLEADLDLELKDIMSTSAGWEPWSERRDTIVDLPVRPVELLDLIPTTTTTATGSIDYWEETVLDTTAAVEIAEGDPYPETTYNLEEVPALIRKIGVKLRVTDEQLEDVPRLQSRLDIKIPFLVRQRMSLQIAVGSGSGVNLRGILNVSGIQTQAKGSDPAPDTVYKAMTKVMTTGQAVPDAYVTNPLDWQDIRLLRTADGIYIWGSPSDAAPARIWGLRVVLAQAMTQNTSVVGDFANFSELAVRKGVTVKVGLDSDDFGHGRQTLRADMRAALIWYRPSAFCTCTSI